MENDVIKIISMIIDDSSDRIIEIRNAVFKLLGINIQYEKMIEYIKECLERFSFNNVENQFFEQIRNIVIEEINKNDLRIKKNESVDYEQFISNLTEKLRQVQAVNLIMDDDLKQLAEQIANRFPEVNITRDQFYSHFMGKKEQIISMINHHNQNIIDILVKLTPQLANELKNQHRKNSGASNDVINNEDIGIRYNTSKTEPPKTPTSPMPSASAYVGMSAEEIKELITQKKYYSILQGISKEDVPKYTDFINTGFQVIINDFLIRANECKTYEERHNAYFELYEIYQNFRDYISLESSNQLREQLDSMHNYLQQQLKTNEDIGIRYNTSKTEQSSSTMRR